MEELGGKVEGLDWVVGGKLQQPQEGLETAVELVAPRGFLWVSKGRGRVNTLGTSQGNLPLHSGGDPGLQSGEASSSESTLTENQLCGGLPNPAPYQIPTGDLLPPSIVCVSLVTQSCPTLCNPLDYNPPGSFVSCPGFPRQEYQSRLPFPPPGDLPKPGIEPTSLTSPALQVDSLPAEP